MNNKKVPNKRGRPKGIKYDHLARIPIEKEVWDELGEKAKKEGEKSASKIVRRLIKSYLGRA